MKCKAKYLFLTFVVLVGSRVHAGIEDLDSFLAEYIGAFSLDQDVSEYFVDSPHFIFGSHLLAPESRTEAGEFIRDIRTKLKQSEYGSTEIVESSLRVKLDGYSLVTLLLQRYKINGESLDMVCSTYGVLDGEHGYEIISWQPSSVNMEGQCE